MKLPYMLFDARDRQPRVLIVNELGETLKLPAGKRLGFLVDVDDIAPARMREARNLREINVAEDLFAMGWMNENRFGMTPMFTAKSVRSMRGTYNLCLDYRAIDRRMKLVKPRTMPSLAGALEFWRSQHVLTLARRLAEEGDAEVVDLGEVEWLRGDLA